MRDRSRRLLRRNRLATTFSVDAATKAGKDKSAAPKRQGKNPAAVALGRLGGLKGGRARAESLSDDERRHIARRAAQARWANKARDDD